MADISGGLTTPFLAAFDPDGSKTDQLMGRGRGGAPQGGGGEGGGCGPPYTESYDHEFEPDSGTWPGGVDASHYCKHCGVVESMHGGGGGGGGPLPGRGRGGSEDPDDEDFSDNPHGWRYTESENGVRYSHVPPGTGR